MKGFETRADALAANSCSGYRIEVIPLECPFGSAPVGTGYALLARHGRDDRSPLGCVDARLHLRDEWIDGPRAIAELLGVDQ